MQTTNNQLGFIEPASLATVGVSLVSSLFQDKYAATNQALDQVSKLNANTTTSAAQLQQVTNQIESAYVQTVNSLKDKHQLLKQLPDGDNGSKAIKVAGTIALASLVGTIAIKAFM